MTFDKMIRHLQEQHGHKIEAALLRALGHGNSLAVWPPMVYEETGGFQMVLRTCEVTPEQLAALRRGEPLPVIAGAILWALEEDGTVRAPTAIQTGFDVGGLDGTG